MLQQANGTDSFARKRITLFGKNIRTTWHIGLVVCFVILILAAAWFSVLNSADQARQDRLQEVVHRNDDLARAYEEHVRRVISGADMMLRLVQSSHSDPNLLNAHFESVRRHFSSLSFLTQLYVADEHGHRTSSVVPSPPGMLGVDDREYFSRAKTASPDELIVSTPHIGRLSNKTSIVLARRLPTADGIFRGIVAAGLDADYFTHFYRTLQIDARQATMIVGTDGVVRFRLAGADRSVGQNIRNAELFQRLKDAPTGNYRAVSLFDGKPRLLSYRALPDYPLIVVISVDEAAALEGIDRQFRMELFKTSVFSIIVLAIAFLLIVSRLRQRALTKDLLAREQSLVRKTILSDSIHKIIQDLLARQNSDELIQRLLQEARRLVDAPIASLALREDSTGDLIIVAWESDYYPERKGLRIPRGQGASSRVLENGQPLYIEDYRAFPGRVADSRLDRITSSYTLPLKSGNAVFGAVAVQFLDNVRHFSREETEALDLLFSMASLILVNADLFEKQKAELAKEKILAGQVRAAGNAQRLMLPQDTETDHVSIRTLFEPYHPVSGDSFGLHWNRSRTSLYGYILDITGHGVVTALQTAAADALVRQLVASEPPFSSYFLQELNRRLAPVLNEDTFAGFLGFVFDFKTKTLSYGAGGINHFLAYTDGTGLIVQVPGCFLGMVENPDVSVASIKFHPGDTFYFLTDGLEERLPNRMVDILGDFDFSIDVLRRLAKADDRWDDCAAICFRIKQ